MIVLFCNGGEVSQLLGVFDNAEAAEPTIVSVINEAGLTPDEGYRRVAIGGKTQKVRRINVVERGAAKEDWALTFTIAEVPAINTQMGVELN